MGRLNIKRGRVFLPDPNAVKEQTYKGEPRVMQQVSIVMEDGSIMANMTYLGESLYLDTAKVLARRGGEVVQPVEIKEARWYPVR